MTTQRKIAQLLTKAEKNRGNYTSTQKYCILLDDIIINQVFKEGDEQRYTNPLTSYDLLTKSAVKTSLQIILKQTKSKIWAQKMNLQSTEIIRSSNLLKSHSGFKIQAKINFKICQSVGFSPLFKYQAFSIQCKSLYL